MFEAQCIGCGCSDMNACVKGNETCHWLSVDYALQLGVCSNCPGYLKKLEKRQEELAELAAEG